MHIQHHWLLLALITMVVLGVACWPATLEETAILCADVARLLVELNAAVRAAYRPHALQ